MLITKLELLKKSRYRVQIDEEEEWILPPEVVKEQGLKENREIPEDVYAFLYEEYVYQPAVHKALNLLERKDYTQQEIYERLLCAGYPADAATDAVAYLRSHGYLDDRRFVKQYLDWHAEGKSREMVFRILQAKGLDRDLIRSCMDEWERDDQTQIRKIYQSKFSDRDPADFAQREKIFQYFLRKGYRYADIADVIREINSF